MLKSRYENIMFENDDLRKKDYLDNLIYSEDLAEKIARTVVRTGKSVTLEPMTAYERKIIHTKLQTHSKVETISKGEEPYRKVVIKLKNNK